MMTVAESELNEIAQCFASGDHDAAFNIFKYWFLEVPWEGLPGYVAAVERLVGRGILTIWVNDQIEFLNEIRDPGDESLPFVGSGALKV